MIIEALSKAFVYNESASDQTLGVADCSDGPLAVDSFVDVPGKAYNS